MKLKTLTLKNFKGVRGFVLHAGDQVLHVYGDNATGKTTLADSFSWLLFGRDSRNSADFEIKTLDEAGDPIPGLQHEVEAVLGVDDQRQITLKRVYYEKWTRKRGAAKSEFTGHTTDYYIDGVPVKKKEYDAHVAEIAPADLFRLLTDPRHFNEHLHWQERRRLLLEVCGDVTDADVIATSDELAELPAILGKRSIDDHRKVVISRRQEINKELERLPVRIDETQRGLPQDDDRATVEAELADLRDLHRAQSEELTRLKSGGQLAELKRQRSEKVAALSEVRTRAREAASSGTDEIRRQRNELADQLARQDAEAKRLRDQLSRDQGELDRVREKQTAKREEWKRKKAETIPEPEVQDVCPACGQSLPSDQVETARQKAIEEHNASRARRLEAVTEEGRRAKARGDEIEHQIDQALTKLDELDNVLGDLGDRITDLDSQIANAAEPNTEADPEVQRLSAEIERLDGEIEKICASSAEAIEAAQAAIREIDTAIEAQQARIADIDTRERGLARIAELQAEEKRLAAEYEHLERELYLADQFTRAKVRLLTERINSYFRIARFRLFDELVNGGIEETCETTVDGVPWASLNNGARIQVGLDIIETLGRHYDIRPPVWIDNAESVTDIPDTTAQQIRLVVSQHDAQLRTRNLVEEEEVANVG